jgi:predicted tellurium resistance membrane protein TerC
MIELLTDPQVWVSFLALSALEIILGIDNVIFLSLITDKLDNAKAKRVRQLGLLMALIFRVALLLTATWLMKAKAPIFTLDDYARWWEAVWGTTWPKTWPISLEFSVRDLILIAGGLFLIVKSTQEVHGEIEGEEESNGAPSVASSFAAVVAQIVVIDAIFSIDSIITAVGMADHIQVMIAAVILAVAVMYFAVEPVSNFINRHPTTKMLALTFLMLIGVALIADGFEFHIERAYIYFAMAFAGLVELFNIMAFRRRLKRRRLPSIIKKR